MTGFVVQILTLNDNSGAREVGEDGLTASLHQWLIEMVQALLLQMKTLSGRPGLGMARKNIVRDRQLLNLFVALIWVTFSP